MVYVALASTIKLFIIYRNGKIVWLLGNANFVKVIMVKSQSCLKQRHQETCGFDIVGSNNDINVLNWCNMFNGILEG